MKAVNIFLNLIIMSITTPSLAANKLISGNSYRLISTCSSENKVMAIEGARKDNYAKAIIAPKDLNDKSQVFKIEKVNSTAYKLTASHSGKVLDIVGQSKASGADLIQYSYGGTQNQLFKILNPSSEIYSFQSVNSNLMLDLKAADTRTGNTFVQYENNGTCAQKFKLEKVTSGTPVPTPTPTPTPTPNPTPPENNKFTLGMRPFSSTSSWNKQVPTNAIYTELNWPASTGYNYSVNWSTYSPAVYLSKDTDPLVQVSMPDNWGWPAQTLQLRIASGVSGAQGTDGEIIIIDGSTVHNCWQFKRTSNTTATCEAYGRTNILTESGWGSKSPFRSAGIVATGSSQMAGLLVQAETDAGEINHALQIALDGQLNRPGHTGEAISGDGNSANGISMEGERLAIPRNTKMPDNLSALGQKVFRALQNYGAFNIDVAGGVTILRAQNNAYTESVIGALQKDMGKLIPLLQRVD